MRKKAKKINIRKIKINNILSLVRMKRVSKT